MLLLCCSISNDISSHADFQVDGSMVADFCSVILIHNTLQGEITISSTSTTRVNGKIIPLFPILQHFHMQRLKIIGFMAIKVCFLQKMKMENVDKMNFLYYVHITLYWLFFTHSIS